VQGPEGAPLVVTKKVNDLIRLNLESGQEQRPREVP
jgi:hypothetical protein